MKICQRALSCLFIHKQHLHHSVFTTANRTAQHRSFHCKTITGRPQLISSHERTDWRRGFCPPATCMSTSNTHRDVISFGNPAFRDYLEKMVEEVNVVKSGNRDQSMFSPVRMELVKLYRLHQEKEKELMETESMGQDISDREMLTLINEEKKQIKENQEQYEEQMMELLYDIHDVVGDVGRDLLLECVPGVGGQEAMLFTSDVFDMYRSYCTARNWSFEVMEYQHSDTGGVRKAVVSVSGEGAERCLRFESGVHRVQRVPKTERSGRVHTSTVAVIILPQPTPIEVQINPKDLKMDTYRAGGKGGQHVNKTDSAVRLTHSPSGLVVECQVDRSQIKNREMALKILRSRLYENKQREESGKIKSSRKLQMGSKGRSEKIRTYNFTQDRVTDHRIQCSVYDIEDFMVAGDNFHTMMEELQEAYRRDSLLAAVEEHEQANKSERKKQ